MANQPELLKQPLKRMGTVENVLASIANHNAYHLGQVVLLRQLLDSWPPPSGGDSW